MSDKRPWIGCSEPHHVFHYIGRFERDYSEGNGPKAGWLTWQSEDHPPSVEGVIRHWFAIEPEKFWLSRTSTSEAK